MTVDELTEAYDCELAFIMRLDNDGYLHPVAGAGPLAAELPPPKEWSLSPEEGVSGRVVRTGEPALIHETRDDPDFVGPSSEGSELSLPIRVAGRLWGVLDIGTSRSGAYSEEDLLLADTLAAQVGAALHRGDLFHELESAFAATLAVVSDALEDSAAHADELAELAVRVGRRLGLLDQELRFVRYAALLHDIGNVAVPGDLLSKPTPLSLAEFEEIKRHPVVGAQMLDRIPFFGPVQPLVRSAHERWDGRGYPDGLAGEAIPVGARVVGACDAFLAMRSDRPYSGALELEEAIAELHRGAGTQFDPPWCGRSSPRSARPARRAADLVRPAADALDLCGERQQRVLLVRAGHGLDRQRQPVVGDARRERGGRLAGEVPDRAERHEHAHAQDGAQRAPPLPAAHRHRRLGERGGEQHVVAVEGAVAGARQAGLGPPRARHEVRPDEPPRRRHLPRTPLQPARLGHERARVVVDAAQPARAEQVAQLGVIGLVLADLVAERAQQVAELAHRRGAPPRSRGLGRRLEGEGDAERRRVGGRRLRVGGGRRRRAVEVAVGRARERRPATARRPAPCA